MKISKNNHSPNDRFLIKIFIKIISLDSSQRVPPMSPCPPLIITRVYSWLINHLSDPWDFNKSNRILLRSNWRKPYPKFYGSELLLIKGDQENDLQGRVLTFWGGILSTYGQWLLIAHQPRSILSSIRWAGCEAAIRGLGETWQWQLPALRLVLAPRWPKCWVTGVHIWSVYFIHMSLCIYI